jgi:lysozyme
MYLSGISSLERRMDRRVATGWIVSAAILVGIATQEGYKEAAYIPVPGDVPTIGFGATQGVKLGDKTTPVRALNRLLDEVDSVYAQGVRRCVKVPLYQHEFSAYVSLTYNIGVANFCGSTLVKLLNQEKYAEACAEISRWNRQGGKVSTGLVNRRKEERAICEGEL